MGLSKYWFVLVAALFFAGCSSSAIPACENDEECADFQCGAGQEAICEIPSGDIFGICGCVTPSGSGGAGGNAS